MKTFSQNEREFIESYLDDCTSFLIKSYNDNKNHAINGELIIQMFGEDINEEKNSESIKMFSAEMTIHFLKLFFMMKENVAEISHQGRKIKVISTIDSDQNNIKLIFKDLS